MTALSIVSLFILAQPAPDSEFELPDFKKPAVDAGTLSEPPQPPPLEFPQALQEPQPPPRWNLVTGTANVNVFVIGALSLGVEGFLGLLLGTPVPRANPEPKEPNVEGWVVSPGIEAGYAQLSLSACGKAALCGTRFSAGGAVRVGFAQGTPELKTGLTFASRMLFGELAVLGGVGWVPSAPLSPELRWGELILRGRAGVLWSVAKNTVFSLALILEGVPVSAVNRGVSVSIGVGFGL